MDFADFDLKTASEAGTTVHLEMRGRPLYAQADKSIGVDVTDKPCRVHLRGLMASGVYDLIKRIQRIEAAYQLRSQRVKDKEIDALLERADEETKDLLGKLIVAAVSGWENIIFKGKPADTSPEAVMAVCGPGTVFFEQTYQAILEKYDFLKGAANS